MISREQSGLKLRSANLILICILFFMSAEARPIDPLSLADSLYDIKDYQPAITEYKRFLFFDENNDSAARVYSQVGLCYRNLYDWDNAIEAFDKAIDLADNDSLQSEYIISLAVVYISSKDYSSSEVMLEPIVASSTIPSIQSKAGFFLSLSYIYGHQWKEAKEYLGNHALSADSAMNNELTQLLTKAAKIKYKSPALASWLSFFIPGLGQVYAGRPLSALNALAINLGTGYLLYNTIDKHPTFIEIYTYGSLFNRFWSGNRHNAAQFVRESNEKKDEELESELLRVIDSMME
jgi:tetratricopeptide (TPR) repeat protein